MKRIFSVCFRAVFGLLFLAAAGNAPAFAQTSNAPLYKIKLRDGSQLKATIEQYQPGENLVVVDAHGNSTTHPAASVKTIELAKDHKVSTGKKLRYRAILETGVSTAEGYDIEGTYHHYQPDGDVKLYTIHGLQFKNLLFGGVGAGFNLEGVEAANLPVFAELRFMPLNTAVSPVLMASAGYNINLHDSDNSAYVSPGAGVKIRLSSRTDMHVLLAYRKLQGTTHYQRYFYPTPGQLVSVREDFDVEKKYLDLRVGFLF